MCDKIEFIRSDPDLKGEEWAAEHGAPLAAAEIYINGRELADILKAEELAYAEAEGHPTLAGAYGHIAPDKLYTALNKAKDSEGRAELLCCRQCGEVGCWSVSAHIMRDNKYVFWHRFEHNHRKWHYGLSYKFSAAEYEKALEKLNGMY